jgi:Family of unknown function (DUF6364)
MRTTINLDEALIERAKTIAAQTGKSFSDVIGDAVRESMARRDRAPGRANLPLPVDRIGGGLRPGVDLDDNAALLDLMEGPDQ